MPKNESNLILKKYGKIISNGRTPIFREIFIFAVTLISRNNYRNLLCLPVFLIRYVALGWTRIFEY